VRGIPVECNNVAGVSGLSSRGHLWRIGFFIKSILGKLLAGGSIVDSQEVPGKVH
jgi:hypothetical protein